MLSSFYTDSQPTHLDQRFFVLEAIKQKLFTVCYLNKEEGSDLQVGHFQDLSL